MSTEEKARLIALLLQTLRAVAGIQKKPFDYGDTFISLVFMSDDELRRIAKMVMP